MAIKSKDIYKGRKKSKARPWVIAGAIVAVLLILIGVFYGLRSLCVYDEAGNATIIWPWEERPVETPSPSPEESVAPGAGVQSIVPGAVVTGDEPGNPAEPDSPQNGVSGENIPSEEGASSPSPEENNSGGLGQ